MDENVGHYIKDVADIKSTENLLTEVKRIGIVDIRKHYHVYIKAYKVEEKRTGRSNYILKVAIPSVEDFRQDNEIQEVEIYIFDQIIKNATMDASSTLEDEDYASY